MSGPAILLVETQLAQNIGAVARAMLNFGLRDLRLINPQADPRAREAQALAAGADEILNTVKIFQSTREAMADLHHLYATTARPRDMISLHMTPHQVGHLMQQHRQENQEFGVLFGPERSGLTNEDVALCSGTISVPLNPDFSSLNLAQAVLLISYEFYQVHLKTAENTISLQQTETQMATKQELTGMFEHLETELDKAGYFRTAHKKPKMVQSIRTMFSRVPFTAQEIRTFRGIISDLVNPHGIHSRKKSDL
ncbi:MAG: RNA methyltransferase [Janthinobacterium lividum]